MRREIVNIWNMVRHGCYAALDLLIPRPCIVCGKKLSLEEKHLCRSCAEDLPQTYYWKRRTNPMADRFNDLIQKDLEEKWNKMNPEDVINQGFVLYSYATSLFFYDNDSDYRHIPHQLKYHGNIPVGKFYGLLLGRSISEGAHFSDVELVIPVPLHWERRWSRGYNQAEIIAGEVAKALGVSLETDILVRRKRTSTQTRLNLKDKTENVKDAFIAIRDMEKEVPHHILIIDDIFTTGSTLFACYTALREVFPPSVRISVATLGFVGET